MRSWISVVVCALALEALGVGECRAQTYRVVVYPSYPVYAAPVQYYSAPVRYYVAQQPAVSGERMINAPVIVYPSTTYPAYYSSPTVGHPPYGSALRPHGMNYDAWGHVISDYDYWGSTGD